MNEGVNEAGRGCKEARSGVRARPVPYKLWGQKYIREAENEQSR
jgi:hypothetical protein